MPRCCAPTASAPAGRSATATQHEEWIDGLLAVCLQHEIDHLNGVLFIDHLSRLKRDMIMKKLVKARRDRRRARRPKPLSSCESRGSRFAPCRDCVL